jgi:hypothetical protein
LKKKIVSGAQSRKKQSSTSKIDVRNIHTEGVRNKARQRIAKSLQEAR